MIIYVPIKPALSISIPGFAFTMLFDDHAIITTVAAISRLPFMIPGHNKRSIFNLIMDNFSARKFSQSLSSQCCSFRSKIKDFYI